jgi:hypothetical protein
MVAEMMSLTLRHGNDESVINDVASSIETICEEIGCRMEWGDPTPETISWNFFTRDECHEECAPAMTADTLSSRSSGASN